MRNIEFRVTNEFGENFIEKLDGRKFTRFVKKEAAERNVRENKVINDFIKNNLLDKYLSEEEEITSYELTWRDEFNRYCKIEQYNIVLINKETYAKVQRVIDYNSNKYQYNYYDYTNNKELFNEWYDSISLFHSGFAVVEREDDNGDYVCNFIDKQGNILSEEWFKWVDYFRDGFAKVQRTNGEVVKIDKNGKIVSK